jgi:hypothetical protein
LRTAPARGKRKIGRPTFLCSTWKQPCDYGFCSEFRDVAESFAASYEHHPVDDLEPLDDDPNAYRAAALEYLNVLLEVDEFMSSSKDGMRDWVSVSIVLGLPSTRGLSSPQIAGQLGCTEKALNASTARFLRLAGAGSTRRPLGTEIQIEWQPENNHLKPPGIVDVLKLCRYGWTRKKCSLRANDIKNARSKTT